MFRVNLNLLRCRHCTTSSVNNRSRLDQIPKAYNPNDFESKGRKKWAARERFTLTELEEDTNTFRIILPPPNVTGKLHLGHALTVAIQDTIVRLKLMMGHKVEWIPGFDHAGIATHSVITRKLSKAGKFSPSQLQAALETHALTNRIKIKDQLDALGALLDWDREYYTLDENHSFVVKEAFMQLFDNEVIRRGEGLVNWSFSLQSSVSDVEVEQVEFNGRTVFKVPGYSNALEFGLLYHCAYSVQNSDAKLVVATSRPETMFGDVAVAVNPTDPINQEFIGQSVVNPVNGKTIPVIGDSRVKLNIGTGLVKITPAHDNLDFAIGTDHKLPFIKVIQPNGNLNANCGEFQGIPRFVARQRVLDFLKDSGALNDVKEYSGSIGICSRSQDVIEPMLLPHWFLQTKQLNERLISQVEKGELVVRPDNMQNVFLHKLSTMEDWCLSRQIRWGHPIPAYFHQDFPDQWVTASSKLDAIKKLRDKLAIGILNQDDVLQDPDVLDTWFSSALIPLALSNWPDVDNFKEISLMETGHDILLFWVWRMAIMNMALVEKLPFRSVLLHGILVDHYGRKMSKSRGNVVDPMHVIHGRSIMDLKTEAEDSLQSGELDQNEYSLRLSALDKDYPNGLPSCGADALRFALLGQDIYDQDLTLSVEYLENCKHFCNKMWQAMRLYLHYFEQAGIIEDLPTLTPAQFSSLRIPMMDRWILDCLYNFVNNYETNIRNCKFHVVTGSIRTFFYSQYCDVYLEFVKLELKKKMHVKEHLQVMHYVLCATAKMVHPFMPFVTEEIWSILTEDREGILIQSKQLHAEDIFHFHNVGVANQMEKLLRLIKQVRSFKVRYFPGLKESPTLTIEIHKDDEDIIEVQSYIESLCKVLLTFDILGRNPTSDSLGIVFDLDGGRSCRVSCSRENPALVIPKIGEAQLMKLQVKLDKLKKQFDNPAFQEYAPEEAKEKLRRKVQLLESRINNSNEGASETSPKQPTDSNS